MPAAEREQEPVPAAGVPGPPDLTDLPQAPAVVLPAHRAEIAESELRRFGLRAVRVEPHGDLARLVVGRELFAAVSRQPLRREVDRMVHSAGFRFVSLDLADGEPPDNKWQPVAPQAPDP